jgi:hypothetical protein
MYHELLVAGYSAHNVFSNGFGTDLTLDHHGGVPHNNLWTNIDLVRCTTLAFYLHFLPVSSIVSCLTTHQALVICTAVTLNLQHLPVSSTVSCDT